MDAPEPCQLCLTTERAMFSITDVRWAYWVVTDSTRNAQSSADRSSLAAARICWVCRAELRKVVRLRSQALRAQWVLASYPNATFPPQCLSPMSCFTKTHIDRDFKEDWKYWNIEKDNQKTEEDTAEGIKKEMDFEAVDFEVFAESVESDTIESNVTEVKVDETEIKVEVKADSIEKKKKLPATNKQLQVRTEKKTSEGSKLEKKSQNELTKKCKKLTAKKSDISKLCEKVSDATGDQLFEKHVHDQDKECRYRCIVCDSTLNNEEESLKHLEEHHPKGSCEVLRCRLCTHLTGDADAMRRHHSTTHPLVGRRRAGKPTVAETSITGIDCNICGIHFKTQKIYRLHLKMHSHPQKYQCDICKKTYALRHQILVHLRMHNMRFLCDICGKKFKDRTSLNIHFMCHSSIESRPYACKLCPRKFITKDKLVVHMTIHEGVKAFKCDLCDRRFRMKFQLTRHKKMKHSTGGPVEPKIKKVRTKSQFRNERLLIDDTSGEISIPVKQQIFQCNLCGKKYAHKIGLVSHAVFHTGERPHKCDECDMAFKYAAGLWAHKMLHKGVKPHHCTVCGAQFTLKGNLKGHMKIHSNDKPYKCDICGQGFPWRKNLRNHLKVHAK